MGFWKRASRSASFSPTLILRGERGGVGGFAFFGVSARPFGVWKLFAKVSAANCGCLLLGLFGGGALRRCLGQAGVLADVLRKVFV